jgi:hypothetical protein
LPFGRRTISAQWLASRQWCRKTKTSAETIRTRHLVTAHLQTRDVNSCYPTSPHPWSLRGRGYPRATPHMNDPKPTRPNVHARLTACGSPGRHSMSMAVGIHGFQHLKAHASSSQFPLEYSRSRLLSAAAARHISAPLAMIRHGERLAPMKVSRSGSLSMWSLNRSMGQIVTVTCLDWILDQGKYPPRAYCYFFQNPFTCLLFIP